MSFDNFMNVERNHFLIIMEFKIGIAILQLLEVLRVFLCNICSFGALLWFRESLSGQIQFWKSIGVRMKSLKVSGWAFVVEWVWIFYSLSGLDEFLYFNELYWEENWVWAWWILILVLFNVNGLVEFISIQIRA